MDYYVVVNGEKEGPFDVLSFIKKVKNGTITAATQVSTSLEGPFRAAGEVEELKGIIKAETGFHAAHGEDAEVKISVIFNEGADTWMNKVVQYTLFFAGIVVLTIGIAVVLRKIPFFADYGYVTNYISSVITLTLLGFFYYYVLMTKRSQDPDVKEFIAVARSSSKNLLIYSAIISLLTLPLGLNVLVTIVMLAVIILALALTIFVPFMLTDNNMSLGRSLKLSVETFKTMKSPIKMIVIGIIVMNIAAGILPLVVHSQILMLGLVVIVPISISILAQIYDRLLA